MYQVSTMYIGVGWWRGVTCMSRWVLPAAWCLSCSSKGLLVVLLCRLGVEHSAATASHANNYRHRHTQRASHQINLRKTRTGHRYGSLSCLMLTFFKPVGR
jgi:hypothetical protein